MKKYNSKKNVYQAACERFDYIYTHFERVCVSFSNGKDSGVLLNLAIEAARRHGKLPVNALYIDFEAQYSHAIEFTHRMFSRPEVTGWWVCLPIHLRNAVSQIVPYWVCWDTEKKEAWIRDYPVNPHVITDVNYFPFFKRGMEFEEFVPLFADWFSRGEKTAICVGIRSDESLNRFRTISSKSKVKLDNLQWTTKLHPRNDESKVYNCYPIYDWKVKDIWTANGRNKWDYNHIYDLMYKAGVPLSQQRLCQPYGDDQRQGLYLFKILEPETWAKVVNRVAGANMGNRYTEHNRKALGYNDIILPPNMSYEQYAQMLLNSMPSIWKEHYMEKINKFLEWWKEKGEKIIPDTADKKDEATKKKPSWRRICKVLIKNDWWCKGLSFSQTKKELEKQVELINRLNEEL